MTLTPEVAQRLDRAAVRLLKIMMDVRQIDGLYDQVQHSSYLTNSVSALAAEIQNWHIEPDSHFSA